MFNFPDIILGIIPTFVILTVLLFSCEQCLKEVRLVGFLIHNIEKDMDNHQFDILVKKIDTIVNFLKGSL